MNPRREKFDVTWRAWKAEPEGPKKQRLLNKLVSDNYPLAEKFVDRILKYTTVYVDRDDAVQAGLIGLLQAIKKYDPNRPTQFSTMAWPQVRHEVQSALLRETPIKRPKGTGMPYQKHKVSEAFVSQNGREPLAAEIGCTPKELEKWKSMAFHYVPLDEIRDAGTDDSPSLNKRMEFTRDMSPGAEALLEEHEFDQKVARCLASLSEPERRVLIAGETHFAPKAVIDNIRETAIKRLRAVLVDD